MPACGSVRHQVIREACGNVKHQVMAGWYEAMPRESGRKRVIQAGDSSAGLKRAFEEGD